MDILNVVQVFALLSTGLKAGVLFGDHIGPRFARPELSPSNFVKFQQVHLLHWEKFMPGLTGITLLSNIAWAILIWSRIGSVTFTLVILATLATISSLVLALKGCLPINRQLMTWSISSPPPDMKKTWARWEHVNAIRMILALIGFACVVLALVWNGTVD